MVFVYVTQQMELYLKTFSMSVLLKYISIICICLYDDFIFENGYNTRVARICQTDLLKRIYNRDR